MYKAEDYKIKVWCEKNRDKESGVIYDLDFENEEEKKFLEDLAEKVKGMVDVYPKDSAKVFIKINRL